ncbi:MAG: hypothetical protein M3Y42_00575 [Actinomycetota bacterium]|nr:hypothetical protein [Actinomycetota bacterium]MDQ2955446.1 hypothetical protein [Actinomycetota bacterium]
MKERTLVMVVKAPVVSDPSDWPDVGSVGIFPVLVEHAVAEHHWHEDEGTRWIGGNNAGFDIVNTHRRTDAKTAWYGNGKYSDRLCFAAPEHGFDPLKVDFIAPVVLDNPTASYSASSSSGGRVVATYETSRLWVIPVDVVNGLLCFHAKGRSSVELAKIAPYERVRQDGRGG